MEAKIVTGKNFGFFFLMDDNNYLYSRVYNKKDDKGRSRSLSLEVYQQQTTRCLSSHNYH